LAEIIGRFPKQPITATINASTSQALDKAVRLDHYLSEENLVEAIWGLHGEGARASERVAYSVLLLLVLYARFYYYHLAGVSNEGWQRYMAAASQSQNDLGLPQMFWHFGPENLRMTSVNSFLMQIMDAYVVKRTLLIREERNREIVWFSEAGFEGLGALMPLKQVYQYHFPYENYTFYRNTSKFDNALSLLENVGYCEKKVGHWNVTAEGRDRLKKQCEG
jgi:hypothetical protein